LEGFLGIGWVRKGGMGVVVCGDVWVMEEEGWGGDLRLVGGAFGWYVSGSAGDVYRFPAEKK
jgi:hypothetical protein